MQRKDKGEREMLLIKNGHLLDPRSGQDAQKDILIEGRKVVRIGSAQEWKELLHMPELEQYDAAGAIVAPGLIDVHVHFRDPGYTYKEDILSGSRAAARGGFTTVVLMANTDPVVDNAQTLSYVLEKGSRTGIHVESCCAVTKGMKGKELTNMSELLQAGAAGFTDDGKAIVDHAMARQAMEEAAVLGAVLSFHEENPCFISENGINAGRAADHYGIGGSGRAAEIDMVERDIALARRTGAVINIQHISSKEAVALVRRAKADGISVHAEATPHHFTLTEEDVIRYGTLAKMNPPLRQETDRLAIIEGLRDGTIDLIATDHAPHSRQEKERAITEAPSGIIGLETALSLGITTLVKDGCLTMMELLEKMTWNPAKLYGFDRGYVSEGGPADFVIFDPERCHAIEKFASKSCNSPFTGRQVSGKVKATICDGNFVYREEQDEQK